MKIVHKIENHLFLAIMIFLLCAFANNQGRHYFNVYKMTNLEYWQAQASLLINFQIYFSFIMYHIDLHFVFLQRCNASLTFYELSTLLFRIFFPFLCIMFFFFLISLSFVFLFGMFFYVTKSIIRRRVTFCFVCHCSTPPTTTTNARRRWEGDKKRKSLRPCGSGCVVCI